MLSYAMKMFYVVVMEKQLNSMNYLGGMWLGLGYVEWLLWGHVVEPLNPRCIALVDGHPGTKR
jgi:hypothetical protein